MLVVLLVILIIAMFLSIRVRMVVFHPISCLCYACSDVFLFFKQHRYDWFEGGHLDCYEAPFGGGKTITMVHDGLALYKRYNNKRVFDRRRGIWVTQRVLLLSNVEIKDCEGYQYLSGLKQFVECAKYNEVFDLKYNTRTCVIGCLDEASVQLNSRNFKSNIDYGFLSVLLTCRHFAIDLYTTSQKFHLQDALLRSVTQRVIHCEKVWRLVTKAFYNADDVEKTGSLTLLNPLTISGYICSNKDYGSYDTYAVVENLDRDTQNGDMMTAEEILAARGNFYADIDAIERPSRKLRKMRKR